MATTLTIATGQPSDVNVTVNSTSVIVDGQNNINVEVTPVPRQVINLDIGTIGPTGATGATGAGVASGGTTGQILAKLSNTNYDTGWINDSIGTGTVTSVAMSVPNLLSVTGSPITTAGTLAVSYSGTPLPVVNGGFGNTNGSVDGGSY